VSFNVRNRLLTECENVKKKKSEYREFDNSSILFSLHPRLNIFSFSPQQQQKFV